MIANYFSKLPGTRTRRRTLRRKLQLLQKEGWKIFDNYMWFILVPWAISTAEFNGAKRILISRGVVNVQYFMTPDRGFAEGLMLLKLVFYAYGSVPCNVDDYFPWRRKKFNLFFHCPPLIALNKSFFLFKLGHLFETLIFSLKWFFFAPKHI